MNLINFNKQIRNGGPLTVTHKDTKRYFMTISEAAELVIQSSSLSNNGDVFLLDMGEPISILTLVKKMISLSGLVLKDENNNGDIEINFIGLRSGEKLNEELVIGNSFVKSKNENILVCAEQFIDQIIEQFPISKVTVTTRKPDAPIKGEFDYVGVIIERDNNE